MIKARGQAERYVRALPGDNPPFLVVVDVGHSFELFADLTQAGKAYLPFPDPRAFRIRLAGKTGPIVLQMHHSGLFDEFKDITIEVDAQVHNPITTK